MFARTPHPWPLALLACVLSLLSACITTPVTGRRAFNVFSESEDAALGLEAYQEVLAQEPLVQSGPQKQLVERVMQRLVAVADDPGFAWEVKLIDNPQMVNAFCLPGGKMAVYSGILPVTQTEAALAAVMGHEIGHAVARHGTERLSQSSVQNAAIELAIQNKDYQALAGTAAQLLLELPWGRQQELEADHIGLVYMAKAGYDPREAVSFWQRMASQGGGGSVEWLSTHPSDERRIAQIEALLPEVLPLFEAAGKGSVPKP